MIKPERQPPAYITHYREMMERTKKPWFNWWMFAAVCSSAYPLMVAFMVKLFPVLRRFAAFAPGRMIYSNGVEGIYVTFKLGIFFIFWGLIAVKMIKLTVSHRGSPFEYLRAFIKNLSIGCSFFILPILVTIWTAAWLENRLLTALIEMFGQWPHGPWHSHGSQEIIVVELVLFFLATIFLDILSFCMKPGKFGFYKLLFDIPMCYILTGIHIPLVD